MYDVGNRMYYAGISTYYVDELKFYMKKSMCCSGFPTYCSGDAERDAALAAAGRSPNAERCAAGHVIP